MAKLVYGLSQSLDGYVDHTKLGPPAPAAFRHFVEQVRGLTGIIYGRRTYEIMRYWDEDSPDWDAEDRDDMRPGAGLYLAGALPEVWSSGGRLGASRRVTPIHVLSLSQ